MKAISSNLPASAISVWHRYWFFIGQNRKSLHRRQKRTEIKEPFIPRKAVTTRIGRPAKLGDAEVQPAPGAVLTTAVHPAHPHLIWMSVQQWGPWRKGICAQVLPANNRG